jgi:hypothetical protein
MRNISSIANRTGTTCRIETGGVGILVGGGISAVVASDTCAVCAVVPFAEATEAGVTVQVERFGAPVQANATVPVNPFTGVMVTLKLSVLPAVTFCTAVGPVKPKSGTGAVPVPVSGTVCGLLVALSVMVKVPVRGPVTVGVNVTLIVQVFDPAVAGKVAGQADVPVLVSAKSPDAAMEMIVRGPVPVFVSVTVCAALIIFSSWLPKVRLVGASVTAGVGFAPVPVNAMFCGLVLSLSVSCNVAVSLPTTVGLNVTLTVQVLVAPKGMLLLHELVTM